MRDVEQLRLALDGTSLLGARTGVGHVTAGLVAALAGRQDLEVTVFAVTWRGRHDLADVLPPGVAAATAPVPARLARALWRRGARLSVERWTGPVDVVHAPNFVAPPARAAVVLTVHDLTFARFPEMCTADVRAYPRLIRNAVDRGAWIHVVSDFVGREVREEFDVDADRVVRIYPGLAADLVDGDDSVGRWLAGSDRYVLALGTVEPRKNLPALIRAFDLLAASHPGLHLIVAGPDGWDREAFAQAWRSVHHRDRVRRLGYVTDGERRDLLAGAIAFAYPSLYEGFGHPPLEAMTAGVPVVASSAGALPEILGDAALLVDPRDDDAIAAALDAVLSDRDQAARLVQQGFERVARFSWDRAAADFATLYRELA